MPKDNEPHSRPKPKKQPFSRGLESVLGAFAIDPLFAGLGLIVVSMKFPVATILGVSVVAMMWGHDKHLEEQEEEFLQIAEKPDEY